MKLIAASGVDPVMSMSAVGTVLRRRGLWRQQRGEFARVALYLDQGVPGPGTGGPAREDCSSTVMDVSAQLQAGPQDSWVLRLADQSLVIVEPA